MKYLLIILLIIAICPVMGQNATVPVGRPIIIAVKLRPRNTLVAQATHDLSAVGIRWRADNHRINYIDRNSDLYGKVQLDDIYVSIDGLTPEQSKQSGYYLNNENTSVQVKIWHNSTIYTLTVYRHPISTFGPGWQD